MLRFWSAAARAAALEHARDAKAVAAPPHSKLLPETWPHFCRAGSSAGTALRGHGTSDGAGLECGGAQPPLWNTHVMRKRWLRHRTPNNAPPWLLGCAVAREGALHNLAPGSARGSHHGPEMRPRRRPLQQCRLVAAAFAAALDSPRVPRAEPGAKLSSAPSRATALSRTAYRVTCNPASPQPHNPATAQPRNPVTAQPRNRATP